MTECDENLNILQPRQTFDIRRAWLTRVDSRITRFILVDMTEYIHDSRNLKFRKKDRTRGHVTVFFQIPSLCKFLAR